MVINLQNIKLFRFLIGIFLSIFSIFMADSLKNNSVLFMPREYKIIKQLVEKIASKNNLGNSDIPFSIGSGTYMQHRAEELGLCEKDGCWYYINLDPYKNHKKVYGVNINELIKQSYLYNGIEAYAWNDVVWISKSSFLKYGRRTDYLGCTIGHELSHIVFNDHIKQSIKLSDKLKEFKELNDEKKEQIRINSDKNNKDEIVQEKKDEIKEDLQKELSRESEMLADINGAKMMINAGFEKHICLDEITFLAEKSQWEADTDIKSTHPGYLERFKSLENYILKYDKSNEMKGFEPYLWKWSYDRKLNILTFSPKK